MAVGALFGAEYGPPAAGSAGTERNDGDRAVRAAARGVGRAATVTAVTNTLDPASGAVFYRVVYP